MRKPQSVSAARLRLNAERLEDRSVPSAVTYVNDNWAFVTDTDANGALSVGDIVSNANDGGSDQYAYGTAAFGVVTTGAFNGALSGFTTINDAVSGTDAGGAVNVFAGNYSQDVTLNKAGLSLLGAGPATTTLVGAFGGDGATVRVAASNVTVAGFTITRAGNTVADWDNPSLNSAGLAIQGQAVTGASVHDNVITGNRTAIDVNNSSGHTVRNNVVTNNHTGLIFRNQTDNLLVTENAITNNRTVGVLFLDASGGSNSPVQQAANSKFFNNNISGNWYAQVVDRQAGGSLPAAGANVKDFSGNWFGTAAPVVTTANSAEPGYSSLIPVEFGGTATAPGGQPDIAGPASANFDVSPLLATGADTNVETAPGRGTFGFQGDFSKLLVTGQLAQAGATGRIQEGVTLATVGGTVTAQAGTYTENVTVAKNVTLQSAAGRAATTIQGVSGVGSLGTVVVTNNTSGVTIGGSASTGFTIVGIDNGDPGIENAALYFQGGHTGAKVIGNDIVANGDEGLLSEFGVPISDFVIDGNVFSGQTFLGAVPATGPQFTTPNVARQLVVLGNGGGNAATATATNITFTNNQITGTAGAGGSGNTLVTIDAANSTVTGNTFAGATSGFGAALRVRRPGTTISGNTFNSSNMTGGTEQLFVQNNTAALQAIVAANTFDRGAYVNGTSDVSVSLNGGAARAADGDTLNVLPGTYAESLDLSAAGLNKSLTVAPAGGAVNVTGDLTLDGNDAITLDATGASADQLNVAGAVTLGGAALTVNSAATLPAGSTVTLIANGGTDAVSGAFAGLPEGATVTASNGQQFVISYAGGDGNDVVLTVPTPPTSPPPVTVPPTSPPPATVPPLVQLSAVGADAGANGHVKVYNPDGSLRFSFFAFQGFNGGVRVATGDVNGDGTDDIVVGAGPGAPGGHVKVFDGATGAEIASFFSFQAGYTGGVNVAVGDIDNDGDNDLVVGSGAGASHVKVFDFATRTELMSFFAYAPGYTGGISVAAGNVDGAAGDEVITGALQSAAHVKAFSFAAGEVASFIAGGVNAGINVAAADLTGDNFAELLLAPSTGNGPVQIFSGGSTTATASFDAGFAGNRGGLRVATGDAAGDGRPEILVSAGPGLPALVNVFDSSSLSFLGSFSAFDNFLGGVFVG